MKRFFQMIIAALAIALSAGCSQIDTGTVGVVTSFGKISPEELPPTPFAFTGLSSVTDYTTKEVPLQMTDLRPRAKDNLTLADLDVDIYIQPNAAMVADTVIKYKGDASPTDDKSLFAGANKVTREAREAIYQAVSELEATTMHTKRPELAAAIQSRLQSELDKTDKGVWMVTSVNVRNLVTDPALEASIKTAAQRDFQIAAKKKEIELANAEAERIRAEAQGRADAAKIEATAVSTAGPEYLRKMELENQRAAIEKWDGKLPVTSAGGVTPLLNLK